MHFLMEHPWQCGDKDCAAPGGWHKSIWDANHEVEDAEDFPYLCSDFADGDWEPCTEEDMPTHEENIEAWREYFMWAAESGEDPLEEFFLIKYAEQRTEDWRLNFRDTGERIEVYGGLRDVGHYSPLPDDVLAWACAEREEDTGMYVLDPSLFEHPLTLGHLRFLAEDNDPNVQECFLEDNAHLVIVVSIDVRHDRDPEEIQAEIRAKAEKSILDLEA